jgi:transcriptional regulator with XRE-family HTH domain
MPIREDSYDLPMTDTELSALGKSIREARETQAMTPAELARAANIARERLEALEAGRLAPTDDLLLALSTGLRIDANAFAVHGGPMDTAAVLAAFGRRLRRTREQQGLSRDALGSLAGGISRVSIYKLETGRSDPRLTTVQRLAHGLRVPPRALIEEDGESAALGA